MRRGQESIMKALYQPLAERMRPQIIDEVLGQDHLLGAGAPLRVLLAHGQCPSLVFWGPPGVGKTTIARLIAKQVDAHFIALSAVLAGVKELREAVAQAQQQRQGLLARRTILFVDEIHRFNKSQQDALLPFVEDGTPDLGWTAYVTTIDNFAFGVTSNIGRRLDTAQEGIAGFGRVGQDGVHGVAVERSHRD